MLVKAKRTSGLVSPLIKRACPSWTPSIRRARTFEADAAFKGSRGLSNAHADALLGAQSAESTLLFLNLLFLQTVTVDDCSHIAKGWPMFYCCHREKELFRGFTRDSNGHPSLPA